MGVWGLRYSEREDLKGRKQPRQPFLSQSAMHGSHVLACNGLRLTSQLKWRNAGQPARVIPYIDCTMLSQFFAYIQ